jgi:hypothetical protein
VEERAKSSSVFDEEFPYICLKTALPFLLTVLPIQPFYFRHPIGAISGDFLLRFSPGLAK